MSVSSEVLSVESEAVRGLESFLSGLQELETVELFKLLKAVVADAERRGKSVSKPSKKAGSAPKGVAPPQLKKPRAWVDFTLKHAIEGGWESFVIHQSKTDKKTGEKTAEEIVMPAAIQNEDGAWVYEDSIGEKTPAGRQINHKEAMSLSKQRKDGAHETWALFESTYVDEEPAEKPVKAVVKVAVVRKTAAEKAAEAEAKKAEKEAEKEAKKAEKEAERAAAKAAKEAEKAAVKAAAASSKKTPAKAPVKPAAPVAAPVKPAMKAPVVAKKPDVVIPADGAAHPWTFKGKKCLRTSDNEVWEAKADGSIGKWLGLYNPAEDKIDDSAPEPEFDDEE